MSKYYWRITWNLEIVVELEPTYIREGQRSESIQKCIEVMDKMMKPNQSKMNEWDFLKMCSKVNTLLKYFISIIKAISCLAKRRTAGPNVKTPPINTWNCLIICNNLTNSEYEAYSITGNGNYVNQLKFSFQNSWNHNKWFFFVEIGYLEPQCPRLEAVENGEDATTIFYLYHNPCLSNV